MRFFLSFVFPSYGDILDATCDCGTPWTFHLSIVSCVIALRRHNKVANNIDQLAKPTFHSHYAHVHSMKDRWTQSELQKKKINK